MSTTSLLQPFLDLHDEVNAELVEREREVHGAILALVSRTHVFYLGVPGIAKSHLVNRLMGRISGADHFQILLNNFTTMEDVAGPLDVAGLVESHNRRLVESYLPWAQTAFIDEIWKANDSILNSMLAMFNERKFRNDGQWMSIPLSTVFAASNELPANESLAAIYDRIPQRYQLGRIQEPASFKRMLEFDTPTEVTPVVDWKQVLQAQEEVARIHVSDSVYEVLTEIRQDLFRKNIEPSDRRFKQSIIILRGEAWLDGSEEVTHEHIGALTNTLWDDPDQINDVERVVLEKANPLERETLDLLANVAKLGDIISKATEAQDEGERQALSLEVVPKIKDATKQFYKLNKAAGNSKRQQALIAQCREKIRSQGATVFKMLGIEGEMTLDVDKGDMTLDKDAG